MQRFFFLIVDKNFKTKLKLEQLVYTEIHTPTRVLLVYLDICIS